MIKDFIVDHPVWFGLISGVLGFVFVFGLCCLFFYVKNRRAGVPLPPMGEHRPIKKIPFWKNVFWLLPKRIVDDYFATDPDAFTHQGCIIFTGRQGYGKTIAMAHQIGQWAYEFPKAKTLTNFAYVGQDKELNHWKQLITFTNGQYGVIAAIDEMQNWFSSNQSKDFPPEMLEVITQNRKNRRVILGTAQSFNRLSKPIREQATEVRKCRTFFKAVTFVVRQQPELDSTGEVIKWRNLGMYYFVHTDEIRNSYDTYRVIESLAKSGFQPRNAPTANEGRPLVLAPVPNRKAK